VSKYCVQIEWGDVPHLSDDAKQSLWESIPPYQREARAKGIPVLGAGVIYPVPESAFVVDPFDLPNHWPRAYGLDVGWNVTAGVWGAWDRQSDCVYLYSEHYRGHAEPSVHADAIKARGAWIWGAIDPASAGSNQADGKKLRQMYAEPPMSLQLVDADNSVEAGILTVWRRLSTGRLKVFRNLGNWLAEFRIYRRDEDGKVVKEKDHLMDATRYLMMTGMKYSSIDPGPVEEEFKLHQASQGRSLITGL
jgi:hypothetical protein